MGLISELTLDYVDLLSRDNHHRYRSWEHCYSFFRNNKNTLKQKDIELACLHLGFYLASWGMYRGSSFLLQKDYKIHKYAVEELLKSKYSSLWDVSVNTLKRDDKLVELLFELKENVINAYMNNITEVNGVHKKINVTDTLVTKILLGTMGCVPAYDRFFVDGLKECGIPHLNFNKNSFLELLNFYNLNRDEFIYLQNKINEIGIKYPEMKLIDMYFWQLGYNKENSKDEEDVHEIKVESSKIAVLSDNQNLSSWEMVKEAVEKLKQPFTKAQIIEFVLNKYGDVNPGTLQCQVYRVTVNRPARVNWYPNNKERIANSNYDLLFDVGEGQLERFQTEKHGLWGIKKVGAKYEVCKID